MEILDNTDKYQYTIDENLAAKVECSMPRGADGL